MDVAAARYQPRARAQSYLDRENGAPATEDSGPESESQTRRKFQRTTANPEDGEGFRKPSIPASATRRPVVDRRPSDSARRRSTHLREGMRVPSGPREFPGGSPGKRYGHDAPATGNTPNRPSLRTPTERSGFKNPPAAVSTGSPTSTKTPCVNGDFDFIPQVNFDDFQSRLANFDGSSSLLSEFPAVGGGRVLPHDKSGGMAPRSAGFANVRPSTERSEEIQSEKAALGIGRSASYRQTYGTGAQPRMPVGQGNTREPLASAPAPAPTANAALTTTITQPTVTLRTRRQSTVPQNPATFGQPLPSNPTKNPRKSIGPGLFSSIIDRKPVPQTGPPVPPDSSKPIPVRSDSLGNVKRSTIQPSASAGAELPRVSTLTATTQSRQAKVRSVVPVMRDGDSNAANGRSPGKTSVYRATTPTSTSSNKRQSVASGRMSGLGARTISPTDARRLKRLSAANPPPMPSNTPKHPATPHDDDPVMPPRLPELPRFAQASPSLIPRKASTSHSLTPTSARASPENKNVSRGTEASLSNKSSYQSLMTNPNTSSSRLPQLKSRNVHSSSAQYGEESEAIPPVPAIPKNYESPKEYEHSFWSNSRKSSTATFSEHANAQNDGSGSLAAPTATDAGQRSSFEVPTLETPRKATHRRNRTVGSPTHAATTTAGTKPKSQLESTGRRNNALQPLRLPPLNLLPLGASLANHNSNFATPATEHQEHDHFSTAQTPEPKRVPKTPSTPMTASKATFFRRQEKEREAAQKHLRSASSQNALKDIMGFDESVSRFFDDSDPEPLGGGIPIQVQKQQQQQQQQQQQRSAITPFASGSLPKHSNEFLRLRGQPSGEYKAEAETFRAANYGISRQQSDKSNNARQINSGTGTSFKTANETPGSGNSPVTESAPPVEAKKESSGLRRKLSLGWRRSSSKGANHPENKSSPPEMPAEKPKATIRAIPKPGTMPPPKLPSSATWSGELPSLPSSTRPSLDYARKKSNAGLNNVYANTASNSDHDQQAPPPPPKTRALHTEQPQPVSNRASSWGNFSFGNRSTAATKVQTTTAPKPKPVPSSNTISAIIKDKDDMAADDEMRRLSQKRRDVDQAARETEALKKRAIARSPMSPEQVLHDRNCSLNIFERGEVMDYDKEGVYFTGTKDARKIIGSVSSQQGSDKDKSTNYGYDDERGDYNIVFGDHLAYRYEVIDVLGKGSFGQVVRCVDHRDGGIVAVKIIRNKKRFHQQALVEVGILGRLRDWDPDESYATLSITSSFYFRSHLCIVTPCLSINLYEFIRAHNFQGFSLPLIRRFSRQMVACLVLLQQKHIIHCDLKPENILLCEARKADVRVIDFGSSCREEEKVYTYIQSRFYRSPEVILGSSYGLGIDMWSFGCILAELWTGYPIFPGENEQEQLACIMEIFGPPDKHLVEKCTRKKLFFDSVGKPRVTVSSKGRRRRPSSKTLQQALKSDDDAFIDFIARCLRWDPNRRLKPNDAVNHPFITNMPFSQRPGIPEEARRTARVRSTATGPSATPSVPSPVKRAATQGNAFAQQQVQQQAAPTTRVNVSSTQQASVRSNPPLASSPSKPLVSGPGRRHPSVASANAAAVAGSKRASNGIVLGSQSNLSGLPTMQQPNNTAARQGNPSLAQLAARESMANMNSSTTNSGGATSGLGSARWRS